MNRMTRAALTPAALFCLAAAAWATSAAAGATHGGTAAQAVSSGCGSGIFTLRDSRLDLGWTGFAHGSALYDGASIGFRVLWRCSDSAAVCQTDADCGDGQCLPTCDCDGDTTCDIAGPTQRQRCLHTLAECYAEDDCEQGDTCVPAVGPPVPLVAGGTPLCLLGYFNGPFSGTLDVSSGLAVRNLFVLETTFLGEALDRPCPRCGTPSVGPQVGQRFTCEGGMNDGALCVVDAVSPDFGGVSNDCPPLVGAGLLGADLVFRPSEVTTGTIARTAALPCSGIGFKSNPLTGTGKCLDTGRACQSNADCRRCSGDPTTACASEDDCAGKGTCAEALDQPISCGFWCHCGFCDDDPDLPCFATSDCPGLLTCNVGTGIGTAANRPQLQPNDCGVDSFRCGTAQLEECAQTLAGKCSLQEFRSCTDDSTCAAHDAGICQLDSRSCFGPRVSRTGASAPLGSYCSDTAAPCQDDGDCAPGGTCLADVAPVEAVALSCVPQTHSLVFNSVVGTTGPAAVRAGGLVRMCRCTDPAPGCPETCGAGACGNAVTDPGEDCDDGDTAFQSGQFCSGHCTQVPCGQPTDPQADGPQAADALFTLRAAVGLVKCDRRVCDVNHSGNVTVTDALLVLSKSVGMAVDLICRP